MATIDDDLSQLEKDIRLLKIEYEQFFGGGRKRPPSDTQWRVELLIKRYAERGGDCNYAQRFRYNNLAQTYAKYQDMWRKKVMQREASGTERHFGAAAKAVAAERARKQAAPTESAPEGGAAVAIHPAASAAAPLGPMFALKVSQPEREKEKVEALYHKLIEARKETGEKAGAPSLKEFEHFVLKKTKDLRQKGCHEVEYTVSIEAGRVKLKARAAV